MMSPDEVADAVVMAFNSMTTVEPDITYVILETLHECGIYGEEATVKLIGTLKRLGRDDLLPPCAR
jgi:hypothetical protein